MDGSAPPTTLFDFGFAPRYPAMLPDGKSVKQFALEQGLHVEQPRTLRSAAAQEALARLRPDVIVVAAYGLILPQRSSTCRRSAASTSTARCSRGTAGPRPLPPPSSPATLRRASRSCRWTQASTPDRCSAKASIPIDPDDTTGSLTAKLAELGADLLVRTLPGWLAGAIPAIPQPEEGATYAPRIEKEQGRIDWTEPAETDRAARCARTSPGRRPTRPGTARC